MNYSQLQQKYILVLFLVFTFCQYSFSQTITPPFQEVAANSSPIPNFINYADISFNVQATGEWIVYSPLGVGSGTGNGAFRLQYASNNTPDPRTYDLKIYDVASFTGSISSVTLTSDIVTYPAGVVPNDNDIYVYPYLFGYRDAYLKPRFVPISGNDYRVVVDILDAGLGYWESQYPIQIIGGGQGATITTTGGVVSPALFKTDENGNLMWNVGFPTRILNSTSGEVTFTQGYGYIIAPNVVTNLTNTAGETPILKAEVINGTVVSVEIVQGSGFEPNRKYNSGVSIENAISIALQGTANVNNPNTATPTSTAILRQLGSNDYYSVSGKVFRDANSNGVLDAGESGIQGVAVKDNPTNSWAYTDSEGNYTLSRLRSFGNTITFSPRITESTPASRTVTLSAAIPSSAGNDFAVSPTGQITGRILSQNGSRILPNQNYNYQLFFENTTSSAQTITASFTPDSRFDILTSSMDFNGTIPARYSIEMAAFSTQTIDIVLQANQTLINGEYIRHYLNIENPNGRNEESNETTQITQLIDENAEIENLNLSLLSTSSLTQEEISSNKTFTYHLYKGNNAPFETTRTELIIYLSENADMSKFEILESSSDFRNVRVTDSKTIRLDLMNLPRESSPLSFLFNLVSEQNDLIVYSVLSYYKSDFGTERFLSSDISPIITTKVEENPAPQQLIGMFKSSEGSYLNWLANDGFSNFVISRKAENETEFREVAQVTAANREWTDTGVSPNTTYIYKVKGKKNTNSSTFSNEITIKTDDTVTGIDEKQSSRITLYPNPSQDFIRFKGIEELSISHIEIIDVLGNVITKSSVNPTDSSKIDIQKLSRGTYIIRFVSKNGIFTKTFCKI